jgi:hypothetical protein
MKKIIVIFVLAAVMFQPAGARENGQIAGGKPLNEIKADIGPLFVPLFISEFMAVIYAETSGFGMKAGYDRNLSDRFSAGVDFAFITADVTYESFDAAIRGLEAGIHGRYYPWRKIFYLQAGLGVVSSNLDITGTTGPLDDFKEKFEPYTGVSGTFDMGFGWRFILGGHLVIDASVLAGFSLGNVVSVVTLPKLASGAISAWSWESLPLRLDAAIALGWAF